MLFNSFEFFIFFAVVYCVYRLLPKRYQNYMLLAASYIFYGSWDWRFLFLMLISTVVAYITGLGIVNALNEPTRKRHLFLSAFVNLGILGFFKYFNFFSESLVVLFQNLGLDVSTTKDLGAFNIILPVGISFYTFQTMSYAIDVYRQEVKPTRNFLDLALFVSFFPQLVAGPIERAKNLLPQVQGARWTSAEKNREGLWLILWGLFKKVVIADNVASIVDAVFVNTSSLTAAEVIIAAYAFSVQIYCDFSGYTDIARGTAKLLGFDIMVNFRLPFFARNPSDFWKRWHISLSTWLRDYLYIPLGGNRKGKFKTYRNLIITMVLGGLWHGAAWNFVIWGLYQGILLAIHRLLRPLLHTVLGREGGLWTAFKVFVTFQLMAVGWMIFRSESLDQLANMATGLLGRWSSVGSGSEMLFSLLVYSWPLILVQFIQENKGSLLPHFTWPQTARAALYSFFAYMIFAYGVIDGQEFIYFQF